MRNPAKILDSNSGKVRIAAIVLGIIITAALTAWAIILFGHFGQGGTHGMVQGAQETGAPEGDGSGTDTPGSPDEPDSSTEGSPAIPEPAETPEPPPDIGEREISEAFPDISRELGEIAAQYGSVSVSLAVYDDGSGAYYTYSYGFADREAGRRPDAGTKYCTASLSKLVTAVCVMTLVDGDFIDLDSDISNYFGYAVINPHFPDTHITARMLLQHTSSIFDSGAFQESSENGSSEPVRELIESGSSFRRNNPGTRYEYSDFGYAVLGALCERVSGKPLDTMAREFVFDPLNIDAAYVPGNLWDTENIAVIYDSGHEISRSVQEQLEIRESDALGHDLHLAQGNLTISAVDYAKIMALLGNGGAVDGVRVLSVRSVREMHTADVEGPDYMQGLATRYSRDGFIDGEGFYWNAGSSHGINSQYIYSTGPNRGVVVITSGASANRLENGMIDVCEELSRCAWKVFEESAAEPKEEG